VINGKKTGCEVVCLTPAEFAPDQIRVCSGQCARLQLIRIKKPQPENAQSGVEGTSAYRNQPDERVQ